MSQWPFLSRVVVFRHHTGFHSLPRPLVLTWSSPLSQLQHRCPLSCLRLKLGGLCSHVFPLEFPFWWPPGIPGRWVTLERSDFCRPLRLLSSVGPCWAFPKVEGPLCSLHLLGQKSEAEEWTPLWCQRLALLKDNCSKYLETLTLLYSCVLKAQFLKCVLILELYTILHCLYTSIEMNLCLLTSKFWKHSLLCYYIKIHKPSITSSPAFSKLRGPP